MMSEHKRALGDTSNCADRQAQVLEKIANRWHCVGNKKLDYKVRLNTQHIAQSYTMGSTTLHLRSETKPLEHRSALTPTTAKALLDAGYNVHIEESSVRIFEDSEFEKVGAKLVPTGSWPNAPRDHIIVGLKELPENDTFPLEHTHVQFAHCYKGQDGWEKVLGRFPRGRGTLLDFEFLQDESGRRVAAFGYHAGFAGAALAVKAWAWQLQHPKEPMKSVKPYRNEVS